MPDGEARRRFDRLYALYRRDIVAYCGWRTASASDAQDAVAEVFLTVWRRLDDVPDGVAGRVWLYTTARRVLADQRRSLRRREALREKVASLAIVLPVDPPPYGDRALVHAALRSLDEADREVLLLAEWEDLSTEQIAAVLGCLPVTARGRLHRARRRFRAAFEAQSDDEDAVLSPVNVQQGGR